MYFEELPKRLSKEEERKLLIQANNNDLSARNKLIEHNLRLVIHIVKRYINQDYSFDDLFSVGTCGLMNAIQKFNVSTGRNFGGYAARSIQNQILSHIRDNKKHVLTSLDTPIIVDNSYQEKLRIIDKIFTNMLDFDIEIVKHETKGELSECIKYLTTDQKKVIELRYVQGLSQHKIAELMDVCQSYVHKLEKKSLIMMKLLLCRYSPNIYKSQQAMEKDIGMLTIKEKMILVAKSMCEDNLTLIQLSEKYHFDIETMKDAINEYLPLIDKDLYFEIEPLINLQIIDPLEIHSYMGTTKYNIKEKNQKFIATISQFNKDSVSLALQSLPEINRIILVKGLGLNGERIESYEELSEELKLSYRTVIAIFGKTKIMLYNKLKESEDDKKNKKDQKPKEEFQDIISRYSETEFLDVLVTLPSINRLILETRFGLNGKEIKTFDELAIDLNISKKEVIYILGYTKKLVSNRLANKDWKKTYDRLSYEAKKSRAQNEFIDIISQFTEEEFSKIFNGLSLRKRQILEKKLKFNGNSEKGNSEIARELSIPISTVTSNYTRLKTFFHKKLIENLLNQLAVIDNQEEEQGDFEKYRNSIKGIISKLNSQNEKLVLLLRLGYIKNRFYTEKEIANILKADQQLIHEIMSDALNSLAIGSINSEQSIEEYKDCFPMPKTN